MFCGHTAPPMLTDLRLTLRTLAKSPTFVAVAVFTLTLGIGVNAAIFSIVNAVVLRGLPFPEQHRVIHVENHKLVDDITGMGFSHLDFVDVRARQTSFEDLAIYQERTMNISSNGLDPERVTGCAVTHSLPDMLRVAPQLGRWFRADEDRPGAPAVVVLGHSLWQNRFKGDPAVLGRQIKVNGEFATVVGVAPARFNFPEEADAWMPVRFARDEKRDERYWEVLGRLKPGVTIEQARAELTAIVRQLAADHPATNKDVGVTVQKLRDEFVDQETRLLLGIMLGAVFLVMLIACANTANLLLSRAAVREKEIAVRTALGSGRGRIIRLLLSESLVLSLAGAVLGLGLAYGLMEVFNFYIQQKQPPYWMVFNVDLAGVAYVVVLAVISTVFAGLWPAWRASRSDLTTVLKDGSRGSTGFSLSRFTRVMVIGEVMLSCVLLVLSGLFVRSVIKMQTTDLGFATAGVFTNRIGLPEVEFKEPARQAEFYRQLVERLEALPEVASAAVANSQPTWSNRDQVFIEELARGPDIPAIHASKVSVSGNYFATLGIRLVSGRTFDERDTATSPKVAVVSTKFAERYWPGKDPLGRKFIVGLRASLDAKPEDWITVVGVVAPTLQGEFHAQGVNTPQTYVPFTQEPARFMTVFTKSRGPDAAALAPMVRRTVRELNEDLPIYWPQTLDAMVADAKFFKRMFAWIFGIFGVVALVLAGVGLYGVMAYSVSQRTQEIGVRMALGASPRDVLGLILREGGLRLAIGLVLGLGLAVLAAQPLAAFLFAVSPGDVPTFATTFLTLGLAGLVACIVPALRALRINPVEALRNE